MTNKEQIKNDFNKIASVTNTKKQKWEHNNHYYRYLLKYMPNQCNKSLDIGCGKGEFSRLLSLKSQQVIGIDLSEKMIHCAKEITDYPNVTFINTDVLEYPIENTSFDFISSIATMHHLPYRMVLENAKNGLRVGGKLAILDLYEPETISDYLLSLFAVPINIFMNIVKNGRISHSYEENIAWNEHIKHDKYMTIGEIKNIAHEVLPGVKIRRHLFWRYSLVWCKEAI